MCETRHNATSLPPRETDRERTRAWWIDPSPPQLKLNNKIKKHSLRLLLSEIRGFFFLGRIRIKYFFPSYVKPESTLWFKKIVKKIIIRLAQSASGLWILIHFLRIRIQLFFSMRTGFSSLKNADQDPA